MAAKRRPRLGGEPGAGDPLKVYAPTPRYSPSIASAGADDSLGSPAHHLRSRLIAEYADEDMAKWPRAVRVLVLVGGALGAWAGVGAAIALALR